MLKLYYRPSCPFCVRVLRANESIKAPLELVDISVDPDARAELIEKGGKSQVPYLEDTKRQEGLYESLDIIDYLISHYGGPTTEVSSNDIL